MNRMLDRNDQHYLPDDPQIAEDETCVDCGCQFVYDDGRCRTCYEEHKQSEAEARELQEAGFSRAQTALMASLLAQYKITLLAELRRPPEKSPLTVEGRNKYLADVALVNVTLAALGWEQMA